MELAAENDFGGSNQINRGEFMMAMLKAAGIKPSDYRGSFAVMHVEDETLGENIVAEELQKGYKIGDRIVRHSMVKVAN